jgi:transposase
MRYEPTDYEWAVIKPFLPNKPRGVPRVNDRRVLNGIFWVLRSGAPWHDLATRFPADETKSDDIVAANANVIFPIHSVGL